MLIQKIEKKITNVVLGWIRDVYTIVYTSLGGSNECRNKQTSLNGVSIILSLCHCKNP